MIALIKVFIADTFSWCLISCFQLQPNHSQADIMVEIKTDDGAANPIQPWSERLLVYAT